MKIVSRTGICKTPSGTHYLDVGGSVNFDTTLNLKGNLLLDSTATIEAATGAGGDVSIGASTDTTIINIGSAAHAKTINIGGPNDTVVIDGNVINNNVTNLNVEDKLFTVNKNGAAASASDSGFEIEENAVITGYVKTTADRNGFTFKAPNRSGMIVLQPSASAFTHTIASSASANRSWTLPDTDDTFAGLTSSQTFTNKTLTSPTINGTSNISGTESHSANSTYSGTQTFNGTTNLNGTTTVNGATTFNNTVNFTAAVSGLGIVPVGGVVAVMNHLSGSFSVPASGVVSNGWMRCDGASVPGGNTITGTLPNLSDGRFIRGSTSSGATGGSDTVTLSAANLPLHTHTMNHGHTATSGFTDLSHDHYYDHTHNGTTNSAGAHTHTVTYTNDISAAGIAYESGSGTPGGTWNTNSAGAHTHTFTTGFTNDTGYTAYSLGTHNHTVTVNSFSGSTGDGGFANSAITVTPKYVNAVYLIRVK